MSQLSAVFSYSKVIHVVQSNTDVNCALCVDTVILLMHFLPSRMS